MTLPNVDLRIPRWFFALLGFIVFVVGTTLIVLADRATVLQRLDALEHQHQLVEKRQCAVLRYLLRGDSTQFRSTLEGCPPP